MGSLGVLKVRPWQCSHQVRTCTWIWSPLGGPGVGTRQLTQDRVCLRGERARCTGGACAPEGTVKLHMPKGKFIVPGLGKDLGWQEEGVGSEAVNKEFEPSRHHVRITMKY